MQIIYNWNCVVIRANLSPHSVVAVMQTPISWSRPRDVFFWPHTKDGVYSVKSGYNCYRVPLPTHTSRASSSHNIPHSIWNCIWCARVPEKIKHFMWRLTHNAISVKDNLWRKKLAKNPLCPICLPEPEIVEHMDLLCPWTEPLWFGLNVIKMPSRVGLSSFHG